MELFKKTATQLSLMIKNKEVSCEEIIKDTFSNIDRVEDKIESYITADKENAINKAKETDKKIAKGVELSPLAGIPIGVKDNICTKGLKTTCASKMLYNFTPFYDATVVEKLNENDMVITGKLNMDEFAMGSSCENSAFKITKNPHDTTRVTGGSSGGSAAAVAAYECTLSLGSDTGGSIRQPSSHCGVYGLKPTYGAVSRYGLVAFASSLDQIGPIARSVSDIALLSNVLYGYDKRDSTSLNYDFGDFTKHLVNDVKGLKIGLPKEFFGDGIEEDVKSSVLNAAKQFEKMGAIVSEMSLPLSEYALPTYYILSSAEASSNLARYDGVKYGYRTEEFTDLQSLYKRSRTEGFGDEVKRRIMLGTYVLSSGYYDAYYKKAQIAQKLIKSDFNKGFEDFDLILTPVSPDTAFKIGEKTGDPLKMYLEDICTVSINIAGLPAFSVPCGKDKNGLPIGMQLIGKRYNDALLMKAAYSFETAQN
jgi:aspartyl-tRNA(Asn)/glutamyl-tRNA(Gln) amidotransferase subunit A